jgi:hypothetical protein
MAYLVIELQKNTLDSEISTTNLLRKAFVVAKKLKLKEFEKWINLELDGYTNKDSVIPEYRKVYGELRAFNPYHGWIPTLFDSREMQELCTMKKIPSSISELEFLMNTEGESLSISYPAEIEKQLGKSFDFEAKYSLFVGKSKFHYILETVRTTVMNWALELECDGILGEEMIFSEAEKQIAIEKNYTVNNFYGDVSHSQIQQHTKNSDQEK